MKVVIVVTVSGEPIQWRTSLIRFFEAVCICLDLIAFSLLLNIDSSSIFSYAWKLWIAMFQMNGRPCMHVFMTMLVVPAGAMESSGWQTQAGLQSWKNAVRVVASTSTQKPVPMVVLFMKAAPMCTSTQIWDLKLLICALLPHHEWIP